MNSTFNQGSMMIKALRSFILAVSLTVAAGFAHGEGEQTPLNESADYSACENGDTAACERIGDAYFEQATKLRNSRLFEKFTDVQEEFDSSIRVAEMAWERACDGGIATSCQKAGILHNQMKRTMKAVRAFYRACTLGNEPACTAIQNFKDHKGNEGLTCQIEFDRSIGPVPWKFRVWSKHSELFAPGFTLYRYGLETPLIILEFGQTHNLFNTVTMPPEDTSLFVFKPEWLNTLVRNGDLQIEYLGRRLQNSGGFRMTGNQSGTQALLAQFGSGQGIRYEMNLSNSRFAGLGENQSGEILPQGNSQALEYVRLARQQILHEAEQGLCDPDLFYE